MWVIQSLCRSVQAVESGGRRLVGAMTVYLGVSEKQLNASASDPHPDYLTPSDLEQSISAPDAVEDDTWMTDDEQSCIDSDLKWLFVDEVLAWGFALMSMTCVIGWTGRSFGWW